MVTAPPQGGKNRKGSPSGQRPAAHPTGGRTPRGGSVPAAGKRQLHARPSSAGPLEESKRNPHVASLSLDGGAPRPPLEKRAPVTGSQAEA